MQTPLVFDIGLHKGEDTDFYLKKGYRVAAFEANPSLVQACRERFADALKRGQLAIHAGALKAEAAPGEKMRFFCNKKNTVWGTAVPDWMERNVALGTDSEIIEVDAIGLKSVIAEAGIPHFAKIDIEGLDSDVLKTFAAYPTRPKFISIESEKVDFDNLVAEIDLLRDLGYRRFMAVQQKTVPGTLLKTRALDGTPLEYRFEMHASGPFGEDLNGEWLDRAEIIRAYRGIFRNYARFGDRSWLRKTFGHRPIAALQKIVGRPLPGWYDTHARLD